MKTLPGCLLASLLSSVAIPFALADLSQYRVDVLAEPGLVSLYTFEAGDAGDVVGANQGTVFGSTSFGPGVFGFGTALVLPGSGHVQLGQVMAFDFPGGVGTIEAWVRADWSGVAYNPCLFSDRDGTPVRWSVHMNASKVGFGVWNGSTYQPATTPDAGVDWHHVAVVFSNNTIRLYWDGGFVGNTSQGLGSGVVPTQLGSSSANSTTEGWVGALDEVAFYGTALSASRVSAHYSAAVGSEPPGFTQQPQSVIAPEDTFVTFSVGVFPPAGLRLHWQRNEINLANATNAALNLGPVTLADNGAQFRVIATNVFGASTSAVATLTIGLPPGVAYYRSAVRAEPSLLAYFPVDGSTAPGVTNVVNPAFSGALQASATFDRTANRMVGTRAIGQNANGWTALTRDPAWEFPKGAGTIEIFLYQSAGAGYNPAIFSCRNDSLGGNTYTRYSLHGASGGNQLMLWNGGGLGVWNTPVNMIGRFAHVAYVFDNGTTTVYFNGVSLGSRGISMSSLTGLPFQIGSASPSTQEAWPGTLDELAIYGEALPGEAIAAHYGVWLSTGAGAAPVITQQPLSLTNNEGVAAVFTVQLAEGTGAIYRWQRDGVAIPGATNATLTLNAVTMEDNGVQFRCIIHNPFGGTNSAVALLTVYDANPPLLVNANTLDSATTLVVTLNEAVSTNGASFSLDQGAGVLAVSYGFSSNVLVLTTTPLSAGVNYTLIVNGVADLAGNPILNNSSTAFTALTYTPLDPAFIRGSVEPMGPATRRGPIVISEIMYHPLDRSDGRNGEFIELYNANPWPEDLSGYRLSGECDFIFPAGTTLGGYLIIAPSPADIVAIHGATNVIGGFTNRLNNAGGVLRLHNELGAVVFEVEYGTQAPWPAAADGAGHSLVVARPSYGMNDWRAWAASQLSGGSPGGPEVFSPPDGGRGAVLINEFLANSDTPALDFIELFNYSTQAVEVGGCVLSDNPATNKFLIPPGTVITPLGYLVYDETQLGFALSSGGETIYLKDRDATRVLDAVRFEGQQAGVATGRSPDGGPDFSRLLARTPGGPNAVPRPAEVVISEIMYHPITGGNDDEFVELHNRGTNTADVSGWRLDGGIGFTLPPGTQIPVGGYLVVAKNVARLLTNYAGLDPANTVGNFNGQLSNGGERLVLLAPETAVTTNGAGQLVTNTLHFTVNEVSYGTGGRWGRWSDGGGSSLELVDVRADSRLAPSWADSDESAKSAWKTIAFTGLLDNGVSTPDQLQILLQGQGECLVDDVEVIPQGLANRLDNGSFEGGTNSWSFQGTHWQSTVDEGAGFNGSKCLHLRASDRGDTGANRIRSTLTSVLTAGQTVTIRAKVRWLKGWPEALFRLRGSWLEATGNMLTTSAFGTPGAPRLGAPANAGPAITEVTHRPVLPRDGEPVTILARVSDPDRLAGVGLRYRVDPSSKLTTLSMVPNGAGWFSAQIPAQDAGRLIAFQVVAQDSVGATAAFPDDAPARECLVGWGEPPTYGNLGTYRFWMTGGTQTRWEQREKNSNEPLDVTFVDGAHRVIYNAGAQYSGSPFHTGGFTGPLGANCDYVLTFPPDEPMLGETWMMLAGPGTFGDDLTLQREQMVWWIARQLGVPSLHRRFVRLFVNGQPRQTVFEDTQQPNGDFFREWSPEDSDGELFKGQDWIEFADNGASFLSDVRATLEKFTTTGGVLPPKRYRWMWAPRSVADSANDFTNFFTLVETLSLADAALYTEQAGALVDVENWSRAQAVHRIVGNWDSWGWSYGKNMYAYKPQHGPWIMVPWDLDFSFGTDGLSGGNPASDTPTASLFSNGSNYDSGAPGDPMATKIRNNPDFQRAYWRSYQDAVNGPLQDSAAGARIDLIHGALQGEGFMPYSPNGVKTYISQRRAYIISQLATVNAAFAVASNGGNDFATNRSAIRLAGTAPIEVKTILVNGAEYPITWTGVTAWSMLVPLVPGANTLTLQGYDVRGAPLGDALATITITFTGTAVSPVDQVVFNEIMYDAVGAEATFVELFNTSLDTTFDLSGWGINGLGYVFPAGSVLTNRGLLVLARNRYVLANRYGVGIPVAGQFEGELDNGGETLSLLKPGVAAEEDLVVDRVRYDNEAPWPPNAAGLGASLQLIDASQDNSRVSNWSDGQGWRFFRVTGVVGGLANRVILSLAGAGDLYIDNIELVQGSQPGVGTNLLQNGGFESGSLAPWTTTRNHSNTTVTAETAFAGNYSMHLIATGPGSTGDYIVQSIVSLSSTSTCTLSFYYLPVSPNHVYYRVGSGLTDFTVGYDVTPVLATPGKPNSTEAPLPPYDPIWLNEVLPQNSNGLTDSQGQADPWIELYNAGTNAVSLNGVSLANSYLNLLAWSFPPNTIIDPGQFLVVWADGEPGQSTEAELHTNFRLTNGTGSVVLSRSLDGVPQILDYFNYGDVPPNQSYGAVPDGQPFYRRVLFFATPGASNNAAAPPVVVFVNEWMAANTRALVDPADGDYDDWFELYNAGSETVDLAGYGLTDNLASPFQYRVPTGYPIAPGGFLLVWADNETGQNRSNRVDLHASFRLNQDGESIGLFAPDGTPIDTVTFGAQTNDVSQGRYPDGTGAIYFFTTFTPRAPNVMSESPEPPRLSTVVLISGHTLQFQCEITPGLRFQVEYKDELNALWWTPLGPPQTATQPAVIIQDDITGLAQRFYRVQIVP